MDFVFQAGQNKSGEKRKKKKLKNRAESEFARQLSRFVEPKGVCRASH